MDSFVNADLRRLVFAFLDDETIDPAYREAPAAKVLHHAWIGGLLEHVLRWCECAAQRHLPILGLRQAVATTGVVAGHHSRVRIVIGGGMAIRLDDRFAASPDTPKDAKTEDTPEQ